MAENTEAGLSGFVRPEFPPTPLSNRELAALGFVSICEARARSSLVWSLKALEGRRMRDLPRLQRVPMMVLVKRISAQCDQLNANGRLCLGEIEEIVEAAQQLRHRVIHGVWALGKDEGTVLFDMATHKGFDGDQLEAAVIANSMLSAAAHGLLMEVAEQICSGYINAAPNEFGGASIRLNNQIVHF
jgi:hypothetical protein